MSLALYNDVCWVTVGTVSRYPLISRHPHVFSLPEQLRIVNFTLLHTITSGVNKLITENYSNAAR